MTAVLLGVLAALVATGVATSNSEARRMVEGNAVRFGDERVTDPKALLTAPGVLWAGKKKPFRLEPA